MNHIYRIVWNQVLNTWVAVAESARGRGKGSSRKGVAAALSLSAAAALATPLGGQLVSGTGSIATTGNTTVITQTSQNLSLNWQSFNIGKQETVNFVQPSASAIAVNRIFDTNASQILGQLNANGQVWLINPNGILFGQGAQVNVGGLVASTLDLSNSSLNQATRTFSGAGTGSIVNAGQINAARGGYVALLGNSVSNQGQISAPLGSVALGAGSAVTLNFNGNSLVRMQIDQSVLNSQANNGGLIQADGGLVLMSAGARDALLASVVNNSGVIEARTVENHEGRITLLGGMAAGTVNLGGRLDASAPNGGNGGFIETSAAQVKLADDVGITTAAATGTVGHWLIDPLDFTIAVSGGDITGAALGNLLNSNSITIQTAAAPTTTAIQLTGAAGNNGDIFVNDAVIWSASNSLSLDAWRNISINQTMTATGSGGKLALKYGQGSSDGVIGDVAATYKVNAPVNLKAGANFSTQLGSNGAVKNYTVITSLGAAGSTTATDLQGMNGNLNANYVLGSDIDATATAGWNAGAGFAPISNTQITPDTSYFCVRYGECMNQSVVTPFTGAFDGLGHTISALTINRPASDNVGLFGRTSAAAQILNVGLLGGHVTGGSWVGALAGDSSASVSHAYATGAVTGIGSYVGGLVGAMHSSTISDSYSTGAVNAGMYAGGLLGFNDTGTISNSYASGNVTGSGSTGGLVGTNYNSSINSSFASGSVTGAGDNVGGLAGESSGSVNGSGATGAVQGAYFSGGLLGLNTGTVSSSYATGQVSGTSSVGGLVGNNQGPISTSYATGNVSGANYVGGLLGFNNSAISTSYATGLITANDAGTAGGFVGVNEMTGDISSSYWNKDSMARSVGRGASTGLTGLTRAEMQIAANFAAFGFSTTPGATGNNWVMLDADGSLNNAGDALGSTLPMLASEYASTLNNAHQLQLMAMALGASYALGANIRAEATGLVGGLSTDVWGSAGFVPVGNFSSQFTGSFDGMGHTISGLSINLPLSDGIGLFGHTNTGAAISNVGLLGGSMLGDHGVGALVGTNDGTATVNNSYATSTVTGNYSVGGLAGNNYGSISNSYASGDVNGVYNWVGGLVGMNFGNNGTVIGRVSNSYASGNVTGGPSSNFVGGLLGSNQLEATLSNSYATGTVSGQNEVGGLVGNNQYAISQSYATGQVTGAGHDTGGLVGQNVAGAISNSYASGVVNGDTNVGGLVGWNAGGNGGQGSSNVAGTGANGATASITNSYATGAVSGAVDSAGGLVGSNTGGQGGTGGQSGGPFGGGIGTPGGAGGTGGAATVTNSHASGAVNGSGAAGSLIGSSANGVLGTGGGPWGAGGAGGQASQSGSTTLSDQELRQLASFSNWNMANTGSSGAIWRIYEGHTAPLLTSFLTGLTLSDAPDVAVTYNGIAQSGASSAQSGVLGTAATGTHAGFYNGYYSTQQGYDINGGNLTIDTAVLSAISLSGTRAYDGTANVAASIFTLSGLVNGEDLTLNGVGTIASKNVGSYSVQLGSLALANGNHGLASNYTFTGGTQTATISRAQLSYMAAPGSFLNGQAPNGLSGTVNGFAVGDSLANATSGQLAWVTAANATSTPGSYAINGQGLLASNYSFSQAASNATALTLAPAAAPESVRQARTQLTTTTVSSPASATPVALSVSPAITVTQTTSVEASGPNTGSTSKPDQVASANTARSIGTSGPSLQIVNGGMRLPLALVNVNE